MVIDGIWASKSEIGFVSSKVESSKCFENLVSEKLLLIALCEKRFENINQNDIAWLLRDEYFIMREAGSGTRYEYEEYFRSFRYQKSELKISAYFNNTQV